MSLKFHRGQTENEATLKEIEQQPTKLPQLHLTACPQHWESHLALRKSGQHWLGARDLRRLFALTWPTEFFGLVVWLLEDLTICCCGHLTLEHKVTSRLIVIFPVRLQGESTAFKFNWFVRPSAQDPGAV